MENHRQAQMTLALGVPFCIMAMERTVYVGGFVHILFLFATDCIGI